MASDQINEIATLISPYNGRWPTRDDKERVVFEAARRTGFDTESPNALCIRWGALFYFVMQLLRGVCGLADT